MQTKQRFVLDTTALTSVEIRNGDLCTTIKNLLHLIAKARMKLNISCHIPFPSVYEELINFIKRYNCGEDIITEIDTWLVKKTPNRFEVKIPAEVFFEYIKDMRERMNRGMRVAEEAILKATNESLKLANEKDKEKIIREDIGKIINEFRSKYRNALRYGTLDSAPDLDVLLLAKEMDAGVVASDDGIRKWAEKLGLRFVDGRAFPKMLEEYLRFFEGKEE